MYVNRLRLLNVKPLFRDLPEGGGALPEPARRRLLLQGGNGSGKTTILETIALLWRFWGEWIDIGSGHAPPDQQLKSYLARSYLAAMEVVGLRPEPRSLWIGMGTQTEWTALQNAHPQADFAGLVFFDNRWEIELPGGDWQSYRNRSLAGSEPAPNVVYFPPDGRSIRPPKRGRGEIMDSTQFNWIARYGRRISLDSILLTVKTLYPERFEECLRLVNLALGQRDKKILGFGPEGRLVVGGTNALGDPYQHYIDKLSSGERQMLLLIGFTAAFLRPGGVLLLDEPDLHIHLAMVDQLLETVERVVQEWNGQLIVASHSLRVWEWFAREEERIDLDPWRGWNP